MFDSFTPNATPFFAARARRSFRIFSASGYFKSCPNASSGTVTCLKPRSPFRMPRSVSGPSSVGFSFTFVCSPRSSIRYAAIRPISSGGHPCIVDSVTLSDSRDGIFKSFTAGYTFATSATAASSAAPASSIRARKLWTLGFRIPSRLYPTLMLKIIPGDPANPSLWCSAWISTHAIRYSLNDWSIFSSCDHSTLYPSSCMSMHGFDTSSSSSVCTVFSSMNREPCSHAATMFCAICECGPAATPNGVSRACPYIAVRNASAAPGRKNSSCGIPKMLPRFSSSPKTHGAIWPMLIG